MIHRVVLSYLIRKQADSYVDYGLERQRWKPQAPLALTPNQSFDTSYRNKVELKKILPKLERHIYPPESPALKSYLYSHGAKFLNNYHRLKSEAEAQGIEFTPDKEFEAQTDALQRILSRPLDHSVRVWRGMSFARENPLCKYMLEVGAVVPHPETMYTHYDVKPENFSKLKGFVFVEPSFTSTSFSRGVALSFSRAFAGMPSILADIHVPEGSNGAFLNSLHVYEKQNVSSFNNIHEVEQEFLLPKGTHFKVLSASPMGTPTSLQIQVRMEVIHP